ncbi:MAG: crossover junction endodeoxyribonuclease RuvC [Bacteroidales bacterium]|nr:crossover junction endodeoxyribonuclease RuvC [Bacteroidales bacterium]MCR5191754.1 crossover junction endodeoxyribonuclease RuvC [Bacteroidales bacterium]
MQNNEVEKIILGIDPGTQILGYSVLEIVANQPRVLVLDVLYLKKINDFNLRIRKIFDSTLRIIDTFHPDHLAIEAPFFGKNVQSMLKLGRAQGVAIAAAMSRDLSFSEYEPATIKQTVTGNGTASKEQVAMMLRSLLNFPDEPHYYDATDALAVAYTCFMERSHPLADVRMQLKSTKKRRSKSSRQSWADFVSTNPDRIDK